MIGSVAEWSKALVLGISLFGGVGSNQTAATMLFYLILYVMSFDEEADTEKKLEGYIHEQVSLTFFPVQFSLQKFSKTSSVILCSYALVPSMPWIDIYIFQF